MLSGLRTLDEWLPRRCGGGWWVVVESPVEKDMTSSLVTTPEDGNNPRDGVVGETNVDGTNRDGGRSRELPLLVG
jgi:hypothetical protein